MKKITACLLILCLVMTSFFGCSKEGKKGEVNTNALKSEEENKSMGRFIEQDIALPELSENERILKVLENPEKETEIYTVDESTGSYIYYIQKEDKTWEKKNPEWLNTIDIEDGGVYLLCYGEDGKAYASLQRYENNSRKGQIIMSEDGGKTGKLLNIPYLTESVKEYEEGKYYPYIEKLAVLKNGNLVLSDMWKSDTLLLFTPEGELVEKIPTVRDQNYITEGNYIITVNKDLTGIMFYNTENKTIERTVDYPMDSEGAVYYVEEDGTLWLGDAKGIHRLSQEGSLWETVVDGALNSMSKPTLIFDNLFIGEDTYCSVYSDDYNQKTLMMQYSYDETVSSVPSKKITVYSLIENSTIRLAISMYQRKNTDVQVEYIVAMGEEGGNVSDYIRALNTELLAGSGADVLVLDGLPVSSYIQKGILADISTVIEPLIESEELLSNIAKNYEQEKKYYQMPMRFYFPVAAGRKEAVDSLNSLDSIRAFIQKTKDIPYNSVMSYEDLLSTYLTIYSQELLTDNKLSEEKLVSFLESIKVIAENTGAAEYLEENKNFSKNFKKRYMGNNDCFTDGDIMGLMKGSNSVTFLSINGIHQSILMFAALKNQEAVIDSVRDIFVPIGSVGINGACKEIDVVKDFIGFLFSKEVQDTNVYDGFPVNSKSLTLWGEEEKENISVIISNTEGDELSGEWPNKEQRERIIDIANKVKIPAETNWILNDMIIDEALNFLLGKSNAEQSAAAVKSKVDMYLSE